MIRGVSIHDDVGGPASRGLGVAAGRPGGYLGARPARCARPGRRRPRARQAGRSRTDRRPPRPGSHGLARRRGAAAWPRRERCRGSRACTRPRSGPGPARGRVRLPGPTSTMLQGPRARERAALRASARRRGGPHRCRLAGGRRGSGRCRGWGPYRGPAAGRARRGGARCAACPRRRGPCSLALAQRSGSWSASQPRSSVSNASGRSSWGKCPAPSITCQR